MVKVFRLMALLLQLLCTLVVVSGQSPCPQYFTYVTDTSTNEIMGQVQIPSPPKDVELHLRVNLSIGVSLPTRYVGRLELAQTKEQSVLVIQRGGPLLYYIHFPLRHPIPIITEISFNNQVYCTGPRAVGSVATTSITLEHILYPSMIVPLSHNPNIRLPQNTGINKPVFVIPGMQTMGPFFTISTTQPSRFPTRPTKEPPTVLPTTTERASLSGGFNQNTFFNNPNIPQPQNSDCGRTSININDINPLIFRGTPTRPGQWPWLAAIFIAINTNKFDFQCAGSLITNRHILTAAHCCKLDGKNTDILPNLMLASLGRYELREWQEKGSINVYIKNYSLHPDYTHKRSGDSDLAILLLMNLVEFSPRIRPICLWPSSSTLQDVLDRFGYVVGWGRDETGQPHLAEPKMTRLPVIKQEDCLWSDPSFVTFTSNRTFCAGTRDGSGPCNGDSGSGLVFYNATTRRYQLRGVVSRSLYDPDEMTCDLSKYVVFVDAAKYIPWIYKQTSIV